jgi:hypothetical protein
MPKLGAPKKNTNTPPAMGLGRPLIEGFNQAIRNCGWGNCTSQPELRRLAVYSSDNINPNAHALFDSSVMNSAIRLFLMKKQMANRSCRTIGFGERHPSRPCVASRRGDCCLPDQLALLVVRHLHEAIPVPRPSFHAKSCLLRKLNSI